MERDINKIKRRKRAKNKILGILWIIAFLLPLSGCIYSGIMQMVLSYEMFGVIFGGNSIIIPHESLWWNLTLLGYIPIYIWSIK